VREYEFTVLLRADLDDDARNQTIERIEGWMPNGEGEDAVAPIAHHWGLRQLAYPIEKQEQAYYVHYEATMDPAGLSELERNLKYMTELMRYLIVLKDS
jgi:small subunit ribosomal protein S6